jgi:DNA-binding winged helix-turn-helix (wHTH) protein/TolB-like protein/tetratricopeptide (TPR) repeat protein
MSRLAKRFYQFGPFRIDVEKRILLRDGEGVTLAPKAFDTLLVLVEHHGQVLEKDELMRMLWPDSIVEEANLPQNVSFLRKALGESPNERRYIVTIPGRGYRFAADVEEVDDEGRNQVVERYTKSTIVISEQEPSSVEASGQLPAPLVSYIRYKQVLAGAIVLALILFALLLWPGLSGKPDEQPPGTPIKSLAVLPFRQLSAESDEYLGLGIADSLITRLSNLREIKVRPTSSILKYVNESRPPAEIGRELGVEAVLDGTVRREGENVRVTIQLLRVEDGSALWAEKFDDRLTSIFSIEDSISGRVAESLAPRLTGTEREALARRYTKNTEAYHLYMKGRYFWNKRTPEATYKAMEYFRQATEKDANYALAYVGLAECFLAVPVTDAAPRETFPKAREAASRAIEIDNRLAEAYGAMGLINFWYDWDWKEAETNFKRAIEYNPHSAFSRFFYAHLLSNMGRHEEAIPEVRRAIDLDPLSLVMNSVCAQLLYHARQYDQAIEQAREVLEIEPNFWIARTLIGRIYAQKGMYGEAIVELQKGLEVSGGSTESYTQLGYAYAVSGNRAQAEKVIDKLERLSKDRYVPLNNIARIYVGLGEKDRALDLLEKAIEGRETGLVYLKVVPQWDSIREEPRFKDLMRRIGFPQ